MMKKQKLNHLVAWSTLIVVILCKTTRVNAQLTADFDPKKLKDAEFYLSEVLRLYSDKKHWSSASDLTISFEDLINDIKTNLPVEYFRTKNLRPYLALQYFYLGLAKGKIGYAAQAEAYFDSCKSTDPTVLDFVVMLENENGTVANFINRYLEELGNKAGKVKFRVRTYLSHENVDPTKIKIDQIDLESKIAIETDIFKSYLIKADSAIWDNSENYWKKNQEIQIYFPKGIYRLSAIDGNCDDIMFSVPTTKEIEIRPYRWFALKLPPKSTLGQHIKIFREFESGVENEINNIAQLDRLPFGIYRFEGKTKNLRDCVPARVEFLMEGVATPKNPSNTAKSIIVREKAEYTFPNCTQ